MRESGGRTVHGKLLRNDRIARVGAAAAIRPYRQRPRNGCIAGLAAIWLRRKRARDAAISRRGPAREGQTCPPLSSHGGSGEALQSGAAPPWPRYGTGPYRRERGRDTAPRPRGPVSQASRQYSNIAARRGENRSKMLPLDRQFPWDREDSREAANRPRHARWGRFARAAAAIRRPYRPRETAVSRAWPRYAMAASQVSPQPYRGEVRQDKVKSGHRR